MLSFIDVLFFGLFCGWGRGGGVSGSEGGYWEVEDSGFVFSASFFVFFSYFCY